MALIKLTKNTTTNNKEVVKKEKTEKKIKKEKKFDNPKIIYEDERIRDEYISHYVLNDGTKKTVISSVPVNYYDEESNAWEEIDNTLEEENDSFVTKKRKFKTEINKTSKGKGVKLSNNKCNVSWHYLGKKKGRTVVENTKLTVNKFDSNNKKRNKNTYENVDINTDLEYVLEGNNIKENIIVKEKSDLYEYNFLFELNGLKVRLSDDKESIEIYNDEKVEFMIPAPFMYDVNGNRNDNVYYEIEENGVDSYIFTVVADKEWINSEERAFPVTIDPQIVVDHSSYFTKRVQYRNLPVSETEGWIDVDSTVIRASKQFSKEYRTILIIKKSLLPTMLDNISLIKLILEPFSSFSGYLLIDSVSKYYSSSSRNLEVDITKQFLSSSGDVEILLEAKDLNVDFVFSDNNYNFAKLEIEYIVDEHLQSTKKTFNLADCAIGEVNLVTGEMVTLFPLVEERNSVLGIPINLINKQDSTNYYLGNNFRLNLHEKLVKYDSNHYIYTDSNGRKHAFRKFYYYLESGVKQYVEKEDLIVNNDGTISWIEDYSKKIQIEYKSSNGYKLITNIEDIDNAEYIEQRVSEQKELEESLNAYKDLLQEYVIFNSDLDICDKLDYYDLTTNELEIFLSSFVGFDSRILSTMSDYISYCSLQNQFLHNENLIFNNQNKLNGNITDDVKIELEETNNYLFNQNEILNSQKNLFVENNENNLLLIKKYFKEYNTLAERLSEQKRMTPIMFLKDGTYTKGYNENGNLVVIYNNYGKYAVVEYSKTYTSESTYIEKIVSLYDSLGKQVSFIYDDNGILSEIKNINCKSIYLDYSLNELLINGESVDNLNITFDEYGRIECLNNLSKKYSSELLYEDNKVSKISTYSNVTNLSLNTESTLSTPECISKINFAYEYHDSLMVKETVITKDLINEKYEFDESGFNTYYYLEENGLVVNAQEYIHQPYYKGDIKQEYYGDTAKAVVINAKKDTLYTSSLSDFVLEFGDSVTTTLNMFEQPLKKYTNAIAISNDCTKTSTIDYTYDQEQKLIEEKETVTFSKNNKTFITYKKYTYDLFGNIVKTETYVEGEELTNGKNIAENIFDENGNLVKSFSYNTLDPSSKFYNETNYNESGQVVSKLDSLGVNTTEYKYLNNLVSEEVLPNGSRFGYGYDNNGNLISITQSTDEGEENSNKKVIKYGEEVVLNSNNNHIEYTYDCKQRVTRVSLDGVSDYARISYAETLDSNDVVTQTSVTKTFNGKTQRREYKWNGNIISFWKDNSLYLTYDYDNKERLIKLSDTKRGNYFNYVYDDYDKLISICEKTHYNTTCYLENLSYNSLGLVKSKEITNCVNHDYFYTYSNDSKMILKTIEFNDGYNSDIIFDLKYDINGRNKGRIVSMDDDIVLEEEITYLKVGDHATLIPSGIKYKGTSDNLRYSYDNMGNINKVYVNGELAVRYTYDALNRLIREDNKVLNETILISYDNNGNIINKRVFDYTLCDYYDLETIRDLENYDNYTYIYDGDKLVSINDGEVCKYDETTGQLLSYKDEGISWDHDKISRIGQTYIYYDNFGRRESIGMLSFTYDSNNRIIKQNNGLEFFYDNNGVAGFIYESNIYIYRKNILGDITDIIDKNGNIIVKYVYDAWGNHKVCNPDGTENTEYLFVGNINPFRYRGYYYDNETKLYFLQTRYYDSNTGRFISPDSIEYLDPENINGLNLYAYCGNNPVNRIDSDGHAWYHWAIAAGVVIGLGAALFFTAGGALPAATAAMSALFGVASESLAITLLSYSFVGSSLALGGALIYAIGTSSSVDEFVEQGNWSTVTSVVTGGIYGGFGGYLSWKQQIGNPESWSTIRKRYWKEKGYDRAPIGSDGHPIELNHPYGRYGTKVYIFEEITHTEHVKFHQMYGYGRGIGGFNRYYPFENIWKWLYWL